MEWAVPAVPEVPAERRDLAEEGTARAVPEEQEELPVPSLPEEPLATSRWLMFSSPPSPQLIMSLSQPEPEAPAEPALPAPWEPQEELEEPEVTEEAPPATLFMREVSLETLTELELPSQDLLPRAMSHQPEEPEAQAERQAMEEPEHPQ